jgi:TRAP-type uncharacterized transport system fused permease subunit
VGAAAGTVGLVIGVVTLTGVGFKISFIVISAATAIATAVASVLPDFLANIQTLTLVAALIMTGLVCILMGCGIPTTATYLIMVAVAAPTLVQLGVQPLAAHLFVFYFGILADLTPPVALAAYAAAGMAGSDPFQTGNTAFRLGISKLLVPFVFVFSPSLLLVLKGFTWTDFVITLSGCMIGLVLLSASFSASKAASSLSLTKAAFVSSLSSNSSMRRTSESSRRRASSATRLSKTSRVLVRRAWMAMAPMAAALPR